MKNRAAALEAIRGHSFDLCVIGGGATGLGCALDATLRGLKTVLIDAGDLVAATSSASTKLVHGGVRYLQQAVTEFDFGQYAMVKKALHERTGMLKNAPYLAHPLDILVPCASAWELFYFGFGMKMYDWLAGAGSLSRSRVLSKEESLRRMPTLRKSGLAGTVSYSDGQFDDARYGLALAQSVAEQGGEVLNYAKLTRFDKDAAGRLTAATVLDRISGENFTLSARIFLNCAGTRADQIRHLASPAAPPRLRFSKGSHIVLPASSLNSQSALLVPKTSDGRVVFIIPWFGSTLVGTTDQEVELDAPLHVTPEEADYLLGQVNRHLDLSLTPSDIVAAFAGVRPLVAKGDAKRTAKLIRDHEIESDPLSGLISVLGGKWTTYRAMAEDGIDQVQRALNGKITPCRTHDFPLAGSQGYRPDFSSDLARHLSEKFGMQAGLILELAKTEPELGQAIAAGSPALRAELVYGVRFEMAQTIEDLLARRVGLQFHSWRLAAEAAPVAGAVLARELGWSEERTRQAVADYLDRLAGLWRNIGAEEKQQ